MKGSKKFLVGGPPGELRELPVYNRLASDMFGGEVLVHSPPDVKPSPPP